MEIQMTDFENAAFAVFIVLVTRAILSFDLNFYLPIPRTTENMETAHLRDAVLNEKFWFRKDPFSPRPTGKPNHAASGTSTPAPASANSRPPTPPLGPVEDENERMSIAEVINGQSQDGGFPGLIPLVESYLDSVNVDVETRCDLATYLDLIRKRADGSLWTGAKWIRSFVRGHAEYRGDSVVGDGITFDLVKAAEGIAREEGRDRVGWEMLGRRR